MDGCGFETMQELHVWCVFRKLTPGLTPMSRDDIQRAPAKLRTGSVNSQFDGPLKHNDKMCSALNLFTHCPGRFGYTDRPQ